jgi:hypothetical protein
LASSGFLISLPSPFIASTHLAKRPTPELTPTEQRVVVHLILPGGFQSHPRNDPIDDQTEWLAISGMMIFVGSRTAFGRILGRVKSQGVLFDHALQTRGDGERMYE